MRKSQDSVKIYALDQPNNVFIAWVVYDGRTALLARHFNSNAKFISYGRRGSAVRAPFRYLVQAIRTWSILWREKPKLVFVQIPPIFAGLVVLLYTRLTGARFVMDTHSASFFSRTWKQFLWVHRILSRMALTTIVPSESLAQIIQGWGCRASVLGFTPGWYPSGESIKHADGFTIAVIGSYDPDEPIDAVLGAAGELPDVTLYMSGDSSRIPSDLVANSPQNCIFTGYLPYERYVALLRSVDAVMDLTSWDNTLLLGAYEAVELEKPLITSDWPILREYFSQGTVHVNNTKEGITEGMRRARDDHEQLRSEIRLLRKSLRSDWDREYGELKQVIYGA